jgi:hypothetical protein
VLDAEKNYIAETEQIKRFTECFHVWKAKPFDFQQKHKVLTGSGAEPGFCPTVQKKINVPLLKLHVTEPDGETEIKLHTFLTVVLNGVPELPRLLQGTRHYLCLCPWLRVWRLGISTNLSLLWKRRVQKHFGRVHKWRWVCDIILIFSSICKKKKFKAKWTGFDEMSVQDSGHEVTILFSLCAQMLRSPKAVTGQPTNVDT